MLLQCLRISRPALVRGLKSRQPSLSRAFITPTAIRQADLIQDLYVKALHEIKLRPITAEEASSEVKHWKPPATPAPPADVSIGDNLARELAEYESQEVEVEGQEPGVSGQQIVEEDWFDEEAAFEEEAPKHH